MGRELFNTLFILFYICGSAIRLVAVRANPRKSAVHPDALDRVLVSMQLVGMFILPALYLFTPWLAFADIDLPAGMGLLGALVFAAALWLLWRSHHDLGRNWSMDPQTSEGQTLVTNGVYRRIRHPMYAAHWLWALAQLLMLQNWIAGPALLLLYLPFYFYRASREEPLMLRTFGEEYRLYMERTGRIFPRLFK